MMRCIIEYEFFPMYFGPILCHEAVWLLHTWVCGYAAEHFVQSNIFSFNYFCSTTLWTRRTLPLTRPYG